MNPYEAAARLKKAQFWADALEGHFKESAIERTAALTQPEWEAVAKAAMLPAPSEKTQEVILDMLRSRANARELAVTA